MKLRVEETGYKSPKTVSDGSGGKMIVTISKRTRQRMASKRYSGKRNCGGIFSGKGSTGIEKPRIGLRGRRQTIRSFSLSAGH